MTIKDFKLFCKEQDLAYHQIAKILGYSEPTIHSSIKRGEFSAPFNRALELFIENLELKKEVENFRLIKKLLKD